MKYWQLGNNKRSEQENYFQQAVMLWKYVYV